MVLPALAGRGNNRGGTSPKLGLGRLMPQERRLAKPEQGRRGPAYGRYPSDRRDS